MKKSLLFIAATSMFLASCESDSKKQSTLDSSIMSDHVSEYSKPDECYIYNKDKNLATLRIYSTGGDKILGQLTYSLDGKDKNSGPIYGIVRGDTIIVDYKFQSEGVYSRRQVVWVKQGDSLLEGYGDVYQVNGDVKFKNISKLTFGKSIIFEHTNCK
ncbi:hypothetical protein GCM10022246_23370 [Pedobacter ginsengiterrae]|uniref:Lipoprotein n=1 Tax=Pedobacter ginsengiterrae TaxID=871696 RepID=A0ABP7PS79_9SPHI|nr:hypothetical protein [Pedobacter aquatilis]